MKIIQVSNLLRIFRSSYDRPDLPDVVQYVLHFLDSGKIGSNNCNFSLYDCFVQFSVGMFDQDAPSSLLVSSPHLYYVGSKSTQYKNWSFWVSTLEALWSSLVVFFVAYGWSCLRNSVEIISISQGNTRDQMWACGTLELSSASS